MNSPRSRAIEAPAMMPTPGSRKDFFRTAREYLEVVDLFLCGGPEAQTPGAWETILHYLHAIEIVAGEYELPVVPALCANLRQRVNAPLQSLPEGERNHWIGAVEWIERLLGAHEPRTSGETDSKRLPPSFWEKLETMVLASLSRAETEEPEEPPRPSLSILVADDEEFLCDFFVDLLEGSSYPAIAVKNGRDALDLMESGIFDVLFTDVNMPGVSGIEVLRKTRSIAPEAEVVVMTGYASVEDAATAVRHGAYDYLIKPFKENSIILKLLQKLEEQFSIRRHNRRLHREIARRNVELRAHVKSLEDAMETVDEKQRALIRSDRMATLGGLAAGVAHEINNPTTFVRGNAQTLARMWKLVEPVIRRCMETEADKDLHFVLEEVPALLNDMLEGTNRITNIVSGLRFYAHQGRGGYRQTDLRACLQSALRLARNRLRFIAHVEHHEEEHLPDVEANPQEVTQVLLNLLINAADALEGREEGSVAIRLERAPTDHVRIVVRDNGAGMTAEELNQAFLPFFTTKEVGKGTGLGLSIAQGIIESHGGSLRAASPGPGEGAVFTLLLPRVQSEKEALARPRILIAEEDERTRNLVAGTLRNNDRYQVYEAKTGAEALELFEQIHAGLLIVDATLPRGSGMEVIAAVRKTGRAPRPHIVALTHFNAPEMIRHLEQAGADKIFLKPFRLGEILEYANGVLGPGSPPGAEESPPTP